MLTVFKIKIFKQMQQCYVNMGNKKVSLNCKVHINYIKILRNVTVIKTR